MSLEKKASYILIDDYLKLEASSPSRHEYVDGQMFAMAGATRRHNIIVGNFFVLLHESLRNRPCRPYVEAVKVFIKQVKAFYYPDVMVACEDLGAEGDVIEAPVLIAEVLSPSTAAIDRREKLTNYRYLESLKEYLIVHQREMIVEVHRKNESGCWSTALFRSGESFELQSLSRGTVTVPVSSLYVDAGVTDSKVHESSAGYAFSDPDVYRFTEQELVDLEY